MSRHNLERWSHSSRLWRHRCCVILALLAASCGAASKNSKPESVPDLDGSPYLGETVADYRVEPFTGGDVHVQLAKDGGTVEEWITDDYAIPIAITADRTVVNLEPGTPFLLSAALSPRTALRAAVWDIADSSLRWHEHTYLHVEFGDPRATAEPYVYGLPFPVGETHRVIQGFNGGFSHTGGDAFAVDFAMPEGTVVRAARPGTVVAFNDAATGNGLTPEFRDRSHANWIILLHSDGTLGEYWHLMPGGVRVKIGQRVARGDAIGLSGFTGYTTTPHLHFEVRTAVDGLHTRSFSFSFKLKAGDTTGDPPVEGESYTAFE